MFGAVSPTTTNPSPAVIMRSDQQKSAECTKAAVASSPNDVTPQNQRRVAANSRAYAKYASSVAL